MRTFSLLLLLFVFASCSTDKTSQDDAKAEAELTETDAKPQFVKQTIDPPVMNINWPDDELHEVVVQEGGTIVLASGTTIDIPANAFVYANQEAVSGNVRISMREFHTAAEVILSGIPMRDWNEQAQQWENFSTAGMFDIRGTDENNQAVEIAPGHELTVNLASQIEGTYDYWYFNEDSGDWEKQGQNTGQPIAEESAAQTIATTPQPNRPTPPRQFDENKTHITFSGMNLSDFPELDDPDNIALQYAGKTGAEEDPEENPWIFTANWYKAELSKTGKASVYQLYLENDDEDFTTYVQATLLPAAYASAMADYRQNLENYESALQSQAQTRANTALVQRSMKISGFGVYNYDVYSRWQEPVFAQTNFQIGNNKWNNVNQVYLITDDGQISVRYPSSSWSQFNFDRQRKNLLVGITSDSKFMVVSPDDFTDQSAALIGNTRQQSWNCTLSGEAQKIEDPETLQQFIAAHFAG